MTFVDDIHAGFVCDRTNPNRSALGCLVIRVPLLHPRDGIGDGRRTVPRDLNARVGGLTGSLRSAVRLTTSGRAILGTSLTNTVKTVRVLSRSCQLPLHCGMPARSRPALKRPVA
jgi:hypothetical protein